MGLFLMEGQGVYYILYIKYCKYNAIVEPVLIFSTGDLKSVSSFSNLTKRQKKNFLNPKIYDENWILN